MTSWPRVMGIAGLLLAFASFAVLGQVRADQANVGRTGPTLTDSTKNDANVSSPPARRKRGAPPSPTDNTNATPAEGQSDLIKVLQPRSRQTDK